MAIEKILVVEDEPLILRFLEETLKRKQYQVELASDGAEGIALLKKQCFDFVLTDMKMPKASGLQVVIEAKKRNPKCCVVVMTAFATVDEAVCAMQKGAFHYLPKPFTPDALEAILEKAKTHIELLQENQYLRNEMQQMKHPLIVKSPAMKKIAEEAKKIAKTSASVLIQGESGTGKEVMAAFIHSHSQRNQGPYICVNCAAVADTLLESEFFGHEKGSFTGAHQMRTGRFELANRGTLLLDEITEIPLSLQAKLLRVIQEREFERVGGAKSIKVDVRIVSTSNRNLQQAIDEKIFREDLFYRLNVIPLTLPPLRNRKEDILALSDYFLMKCCTDNKIVTKRLSEEAKKALLDYNWPGNIRQLANTIERGCVLGSEEIQVSELALS